jgi:hypothetical protein
MGRLDTWQPSDAVDFTDPSNERRAEVRRNEDLANAERYRKSEDKSSQGVCNFCGHVTSRDFCGSKCETKAMFATMGKSIKFHE